MEKETDHKSIVNLVTLAGQIMLENGAETYRVEDTMERISNTKEIIRIDTFSTPTGVFISLETKEHEYFTTIRRVRKRTTNLQKVYEVNNISRNFVDGALTLEDALAKLENLHDSPPPHIFATVMSAGFSSCFFSLLLGGTFWDGVFACICGAIIQIISLLFTAKHVSYFLSNMLGGTLSAALAILFTSLWSVGSIDKIIIGSIMPLLPGIAITSAIRDTMHGDLVSGTTRGVEALLIAISIASGVGIVLKIWINLGGS